MGFFFEAVGNSKSKAYTAASFATSGLNGLWDPAHPQGFSPGVFHDVSGHPQAPGHSIYIYYNNAFTENETLQYDNGVPYINLNNSANQYSNYYDGKFGFMNGYYYGTNDTFYTVNRKDFTWEFWIKLAGTNSSDNNIVSNFNEAFRFRISGGNGSIAFITGMSAFNAGTNTVGAWENWTITMENLGTNDACRMYKNGTLVGSRLTGNYNPTNTASWASAHYFGTFNGGASNGEYARSLRIGLIRSYSRALTSTEVSNNWTNTKSRFGL